MTRYAGRDLSHVRIIGGCADVVEHTGRQSVSVARHRVDAAGRHIMSNLKRIDRTSAERRRALRRLEREDMLRVVGDDVELDAPDATMLAASSRDSKQNDPRSSL